MVPVSIISILKVTFQQVSELYFISGFGGVSYKPLVVAPIRSSEKSESGISMGKPA